LKVSSATGTVFSASSLARRFYCEKIAKAASDICIGYYECSYLGLAWITTSVILALIVAFESSVLLT